MANIQINLDSLNPKSFKKTVRHKVADGNNIYRFLPPFGAESNGYPYHKWNVVWGLIDPNSGRMRPFASPSTYEGKCPVYDYLDLLKQKVEDLKKSGTAEDQVAEIEKFISNVRPKTVYAYNASDKSGVVGVLELKSTAHKKVIALMNKYITDYNQDPTSLNSEASDSGVWFNITRTGKKFDTTYDASKSQLTLKDPTTGVPTFQDDRSPLAENISQNYDTVAYDLNNIYQKLSYDELKEILVANIVNAASSLPELLVPGFGLDETGNAAAVQAPVAQQPVAQAPAAPVAQVAQIPVDNTEPTATAAPANTDDLLALADDIFNS